MGNTCDGQTEHIRQISQLTPLNLAPFDIKSQALSIRLGEVEKLRSSNRLHPNRFVFILPIKQSQQLIKVQCSIVSQYSDHMGLKIPLLSGMDTVTVDMRTTPIIDIHDIGNDRQVIHKFVIRNSSNIQQHYTIKVYPFNNYHDPIFKNGLYEAHLYNKIDAFNNNHAYLRDLFIMDKGQTKALVFVFGFFLYSLEDVLRYRRQANNPYAYQEQVFIINQILNKYKILQLNNIVHRDLRPAKILLADSSQSHNPYVGTSAFLGYQLLNLQSCRQITQIQPFKQDLLLTARGVPSHSSNQVFEMANRGQQLGAYNPFINDRIQLQKTIKMIATLHLTSQLSQFDTKLIKKPILNLLSQLNNQSIDFLQICRNFASQTKSTSRNGILDSDYSICINHLPNLLRRSNHQRIQQSTLQMLFSLHQRDLFNYRLDRMMSQNFKTHRAYNNISILDRLGRHYESIGVVNNDYYREELGLLILMAEQQRMRGLHTDHILNQANQLYYNKLNGRMKSLHEGIGLKVQNAYAAFYKNDLETANRLINQALLQAGQTSNLSKQNQLKLLHAKGMIESRVNGPDAAEVFFNQGLQIASHHQGFMTQVQLLENKSNFQYLLAKNMLNRMNTNRGMMNPELLRTQCAKCQALLVSSKQTKTDIPTRNPLPLANVYQSLGDLRMFRQDFQGALDNFQRAHRLYQASQVQISQSQKYRILNKIYNHYVQHSQNSVQQLRLKSQLDALGGNFRDKQIQKDDRKYFKKIRWMKQQRMNAAQQNNNIGVNNNNIVIQQVDERYQDQSKHIDRIANTII